MKIAILVHSMSGNTRKFADNLATRLTADGHIVTLTQLETDVPIKGGTRHHHNPFQITNLPPLSEAEIVLLGCPVWAFGVSVVMAEAMKKLGNLKGKSVLNFVTMGFPLKCMGGSAALNYMNKSAGTMGAKVLPGSICCQMFHNLDAEIDKESQRIAAMLKAQ